MDFQLLEAKVQLNGVTGENTSTPVLNAGRPGLEFFASFAPAYAKITGTDHDYQLDIVRRYNEQGELNFARLRADAERYAEIQNRVADTLNGVRNSGSAVFESWSGTGAESASAHFGDFLQRGRQTLDQFTLLAETITVAVDTADRICFEKASAVKSLSADRIGPCDRSDVDFLVDFGARCASGDFDDDELNRVADLVGVDVVPALCRATPQVFEKVAEDVNGWLTGVFVPFYEARLAKFDAACTAAEDILSASWAGLRTALSDVRADHFTAPTATHATAVPTQAATASSQTSAAEATPTDVSAGHPAAVTTPAEVTAAKPDDQHDETTGKAELMAPAAAIGPVSVAPPPPVVAPPAAAAAAGYGGYGFFGGVPFAATPGGGDRERTRSLPLAGEHVFVEGDSSRSDDTALVIGGEHDTSLYNEEDVAESERQAEKDTDATAFDDEEDLW